jgi:hypothetical protein
MGFASAFFEDFFAAGACRRTALRSFRFFGFRGFFLVLNFWVGTAASQLQNLRRNAKEKLYGTRLQFTRGKSGIAFGCLR